MAAQRSLRLALVSHRCTIELSKIGSEARTVKVVCASTTPIASPIQSLRTGISMPFFGSDLPTQPQIHNRLGLKTEEIFTIE